MTLSIIIPVYNEKETILEILRRVEAVNFGIPYEIIIIDDGSTDSTTQLLKSQFPISNFQTNSKFQIPNSKIRVFFQDENSGKGAALRRGLEEATGEIIAIQDADLEYNPEDLPKLIQPILEGRADIVYGSRFLTKRKHGYPIFYLGNQLLSFLFLILYGKKITDPWTCYKVFKKEIIRNIKLESSGFDLELELTAKFLRKGYEILELPISYQSRTYKEGKKIKWTDGLKAFWTLIKYRFIF